MRKLIHTGNKPLAQICRRLHEKSVIASKPIIPPTFCILKQKKSDDNRQSVLKLQYKNFCITTQEPNNLVMLNSGIIVKIISLGYSYVNIENIKINGVQWIEQKSIFEYPTSSIDLHMYQLQKEPSTDIITFKLTEIKCKMMQLRVPYNRNNFNYEKIYAMPLLHNYT